MRRFARVAAALVALSIVGFLAWRRNPRIGTRTMNEVVDPLLVRRGLAGRGRSEIATIEHVGRRSGTRHLTPVHPVATDGGFRIVVPLGLYSEWARNVLAAGHCRMQLHDTVFELDEPALVLPRQVGELSAWSRWLSARAGFMYLRLHVFDTHVGELTAQTPEIAPEAVASEPASVATEAPVTIA